MEMIQKLSSDRPQQPASTVSHEQQSASRAQTSSSSGTKDIPHTWTPTVAGLRGDVLPQSAGTQQPSSGADSLLGKITGEDYNRRFVLGRNLDKGKVNKIISGAYIDIASLGESPSRRPPMRVRDNGGTPEFIFARDEVELPPPDSFLSWVRLFATYASVRAQHHPSEAAGMFTYIVRVMDLHNQEPSSYKWREYDRRFREMRDDAGPLPWEKLETDILYMIPSTPQRSGQPFRAQVCYNYNNKRCSLGSRCKREHSCLHCKRKGHGRFECRKLAGSNSVSATPSTHASQSGKSGQASQPAPAGQPVRKPSIPNTSR